MWSLPDGALLKTLEGHITRNAAVNPDGKLLATANAPERDRRGRVRDSGMRVALWRLPEGEMLAKLDGLADMRCSVITPDNTLLATGDSKGNIKLWSLPDGKLIKTLEGE
jgi:WD40 repeat protein